VRDSGWKHGERFAAISNGNGVLLQTLDYIGSSAEFHVTLATYVMRTIKEFIA